MSPPLTPSPSEDENGTKRVGTEGTLNSTQYRRERPCETTVGTFGGVVRVRRKVSRWTRRKYLLSCLPPALGWWQEV